MAVVNRIRIITASNTKIEKEVNDFFDSLTDKNGLNIKSVEVRDGNNNNIATVLYSYTK